MLKNVIAISLERVESADMAGNPGHLSLLTLSRKPEKVKIFPKTKTSRQREAF
jgi:hypothetical protein